MLRLLLCSLATAQPQTEPLLETIKQHALDNLRTLPQGAVVRGRIKRLNVTGATPISRSRLRSGAASAWTSRGAKTGW